VVAFRIKSATNRTNTAVLQGVASQMRASTLNAALNACAGWTKAYEYLHIRGSDDVCASGGMAKALLD
jgi:hypothetical protein